MTERLSRLAPGDLDEEQRLLYERIVGGPRATGSQHFGLADAVGALEGPFGLMMHVPGLGTPLQELGSAIRYRTSLTPRSREIAILVCAVACDSAFEWYAHERVGRSVGLSEDELQDLWRGAFDPRDPVEAAVVRVCDALLRVATPSDQDYAHERSLLGEAQMLELSVLVGYYRALAAMMAFFAVGAPETQTDGGDATM